MQSPIIYSSRALILSLNAAIPTIFSNLEAVCTTLLSELGHFNGLLTHCDHEKTKTWQTYALISLIIDPINCMDSIKENRSREYSYRRIEINHTQKAVR
jgi:hypothetical protein